MRTIIFISFLLLISCADTPEKYVSGALDIIEENSINKKNIDWPAFRSSAISDAKDKKTIKETYPIINNCIKKLNDHHSFLLTETLNNKIERANTHLPIVESKLIDGNIAYLKIPGFLGKDDLPLKFANLIQQRIKEIDKSNLNGWIIDLRENTGGNMWPMYLGLSPIIGKGNSGYFLDSKGNLSAWSFNGSSVYDGNKKIMEINKPYSLKNPPNFIAVLIGMRTSSSGEAITLAFKGLENTKLFGEFTYGVSTGNSIFPLSDGAKLILTTSTFVDRKKKIYGGQIEPDVFTQEPLEKATDWIKKQNIHHNTVYN